MSLRIAILVPLILLATIAGSRSFAATSAPPPKSPDERLADGYIAYVGAESAMASQRLPEALAGFERAFELYAAVKADYPGWNTALVDYRISLALNRIGVLETQIPPADRPRRPAEASAPGRAAAPAPRLPVAKPASEHAVVRVSPGDTNALPGFAPEGEPLRQDRDFLLVRNRQLHQEVTELRAAQAKAESDRWFRFWRHSVTSAVPSRTLIVAAIKSEARRQLTEGRAEDAPALLEEALDLVPGEPELMSLLASAYCQAGDYDAGIQVANGLLRDQPTNAAARVILATAYLGVGKIRQARKETEAALRYAPDLQQAHYNYAQILLMDRPPSLQLAKDHYDRAIELGGEPDPQFEAALRRAYLLWKTSEISQKKLVPSTRR